MANASVCDSDSESSGFIDSVAGAGREDPPELPVVPGTSADPDGPREIENPGDPGPPVLVPPKREDPRTDPKIPDQDEPPPPGV